MSTTSSAAGLTDGGDLEHPADVEAGAGADAAAEPRPSPPIPRHPALVVAVLGLAGMAFARYGAEPRAFIFAFAGGVLAVLAAIDIEHRLLPNRILFPAIAVVLPAQLAFYPERAAEWLLAGLAAAAFLALPLVVRRDAMGMGDLKLALLLGVTVGWGVFGAIVIGCLAMLPVALVMLVRDGSIRGATLPFGPFLAFGTVVVMLTAGT